MNKNIRLLIFSTIILFLFNVALYLAVADDDHKGKKLFQIIMDHDDDDEHDRDGKHMEMRHEHNRDDKHCESYLKQVNNPIYKAECGACHFVYQPELLPSDSWVKILANLNDHFGETVELDDNTKKMISDYLIRNSAEKSSAKKAVKIMRSIGNHVPLRITDIQYIREKHHEISSDVLKRESIGSLSNCSACHTTAENGIYDDDNVRIPK